MRWFVEISSLGQSPAAHTTLCVEAPQWQPALQKARALRGDDGALTNFSIELLDDGYRAIDPTTRLKYVVKKAPDDAVLTNGAATSHDAKPVIPASASSRPEALRPVKIPNDPVPKAATPAFSVVSQREAKPSAKSPLTYREIVFAVAAGTTDSQASALVHERFEDVRAAMLDAAPAGRLVNLAVFDHTFQGKPHRPPLVTLTWKDWKGTTPEVRFPLRDGPGNTPTQPLTALPAPPPSEPATQPTISAPVPPTAASAVAAPRAPVSSPPAPEPEPAPKSVSEPPARSTMPTADTPRAEHDRSPSVAVVSAPPPSKRLAGDELIAELFEAFSDLHFVGDSLAGAEFVLTLAMEKLPSEVGLVSMFDINKREFVVVRQTGKGKSVLLTRIPEKAPIAQTAMRTHRAVVVRDAAADERVSRDERWKTIGVEVESLVCAPVMVGGRYLGLLELANPLDGDTFSDSDGHALTYIGEQFGEFVATHGVVIDADHVLDNAKTASPESNRKGARR